MVVKKSYPVQTQVNTKGSCAKKSTRTSTCKTAGLPGSKKACFLSTEHGFRFNDCQKEWTLRTFSIRHGLSPGHLNNAQPLKGQLFKQPVKNTWKKKKVSYARLERILDIQQKFARARLKLHWDGLACKRFMLHTFKVLNEPVPRPSGVVRADKPIFVHCHYSRWQPKNAMESTLLFNSKKICTDALAKSCSFISATSGKRWTSLNIGVSWEPCFGAREQQQCGSVGWTCTEFLGCQWVQFTSWMLSPN